MKWTPRIAAALALPAGMISLVLLLPAEAVVFTNPAPITVSSLPTVPTPRPGAPYPSNIEVSGLTGTVTDVNLTLNGFDCSRATAESSFPEDIDMLLVGPTGANLLVLSDIGGDNTTATGRAFTNLNITLDDQANNPLPADTQLAAGTYRTLDDDNDPGEQVPVDTFPAPAPTPSTATALTIFNGTLPNGTWSLYVADDFPGTDNCTVQAGWTLDILTSTTGPTTTMAPTTTLPTTTTTGAVTTTMLPTTTTSMLPTTTTSMLPSTTTSSMLPSTTTSIIGPTSTTTVPPTDRDCRGLQATIVGTPGDDDLTGTPGNDVIVGLGGNDRILGLGGDDTICGGGGDDRLVGGSGADRIVGGEGADYIAGDNGGDVLVGSAGDDRIRGGAGNDKLDGKEGFDECRAGGGVDSVSNCEV